MKRKTLLAQIYSDYDYLDTLLTRDGYVLDPALTDGKPYRLYSATVWPLVFYEKDEEKPVEETRAGEFDNVESLRDVPNAEVDTLLKEGYVIQTIYAKNSILIKRKVKEALI